jgi:hypothetical protein
MFGFGMSAKDKWHLEQTEVLLTPLAIVMGEDVKSLARKIFDKVKAEAIQKHGNNIYSESLGDQLIAKEPFIAKRLAAGLTKDDVRNHWNQPMLMQLLQSQVQEMTSFIGLLVADRQGKDLQEVARNRRRRNPEWGDPDLWDATLPVNECFTKDDANIFFEFSFRVGSWQEKTPESVQNEMLSKYTSFNAMIRDLVRQGKL